MTEINQVYKCNICGNTVKVLHAGAGELVCCGEPMVLSEETVLYSKEESEEEWYRQGNENSP